MSSMLGAGAYRGRIRNRIPAGNREPAWLVSMLLPETLPATPRRRTRPAEVLALVVVLATLGVVLGWSSWSPSAPSPVAPRPSARPASMSSSTEPVAAQPSTPPKEEDGRQAVGRSEG